MSEYFDIDSADELIWDNLNKLQDLPKNENAWRYLYAEKEKMLFVQIASGSIYCLPHVQPEHVDTLLQEAMKAEKRFRVYECRRPHQHLSLQVDESARRINAQGIQSRRVFLAAPKSWDAD